MDDVDKLEPSPRANAPQPSSCSFCNVETNSSIIIFGTNHFQHLCLTCFEEKMRGVSSENNICDQNLAIVLHGVKNLKLEKRPIPTPKHGEAQVAVKTVGICCSDVHYYHHGKIGEFVVRSPMIMGHEASGLVTALGTGVTHLQVGDRVTIEPTVPCSRCQACKMGRYNLCPDVTCCATPPVDGNMCQYYCQSAAYVHKVPSNMSWMQAALCEPVACAVSSCRRGQVGIGKSVLIFGAGPIGLLTAMVARASGASRVAVTDILPSRLNFARRALGEEVGLHLTDTNATPEQTAKDVVEEALDGQQPDVTIECSGAESAVQAAIFATKSGGVVTLCGMGAPMIRVPIIEAMCREVEIRGVFRYANCFPTAISLIGSGRVDAMKVVTHCVPLEDGIKAYELASNPAKSGAVKVMVDCERWNSDCNPNYICLSSPAVVNGLQHGNLHIDPTSHVKSPSNLKSPKSPSTAEHERRLQRQNSKNKNENTTPTKKRTAVDFSIAAD